jgi:hypothetical protein
MSDTPPTDRDPVDDFLAAAAPPPCPDGLRQALLLETTRLLRRRRRLKRLALAAALAACYAAGLATPRLWAPPPAGDAGPRRDPPPVAERVAPPDRPPEPDSDLGPAELERWAAAVSKGERAAFLRRLGDRHMRETGDVEAALRCYSGALDAGSEQDQAVAADDNWLLIALKQAREKEKRHAKLGG